MHIYKLASLALIYTIIEAASVSLSVRIAKVKAMEIDNYLITCKLRGVSKQKKKDSFEERDTSFFYG